MELKKIEGFSRTTEAACMRDAIEHRVEAGQRFKTPAPFIIRKSAPATEMTL